MCVGRNTLRCPVRQGMKANKLLAECFPRLIIGLLNGLDKLSLCFPVSLLKPNGLGPPGCLEMGRQHSYKVP